MRFIALAGTVLLLSAGISRADFIGVGFQGNAYQIDQQTGNAALLINHLPAGINCLAGPYQGKLYGIAGDNLYTIGLDGSLLGTIELEETDFRAAAISSNGTLYGAHVISLTGVGFLTELTTINVATGDVT